MIIGVPAISAPTVIPTILLLTLKRQHDWIVINLRLRLQDFLRYHYSKKEILFQQFLLALVFLVTTNRSILGRGLHRHFHNNKLNN